MVGRSKIRRGRRLERLSSNQAMETDAKGRHGSSPRRWATRPEIERVLVFTPHESYGSAA